MFLALLSMFVMTSASAEVIGEVDTAVQFLGPNHKIVIEAFDDPRVDGVACHLSRAQAGGFAANFGLEESPSDASIACRQIGPITTDLRTLKEHDGERVFTQSTSILFKKMQVVRFVDIDRSVIVYLVYSDRLIDGSPKNAISSVPVMPW